MRYPTTPTRTPQAASDLPHGGEVNFPKAGTGFQVLVRAVFRCFPPYGEYRLTPMLVSRLARGRAE
jgi:hypothetical protein